MGTKTCPFCERTGYDIPGLRNHLLGRCKHFLHLDYPISAKHIPLEDWHLMTMTERIARVMWEALKHDGKEWWTHDEISDAVPKPDGLPSREREKHTNFLVDQGTLEADGGHYKRFRLTDAGKGIFQC